LPGASCDPVASDANPVYIYFFWGDGCPHCAQAKPFLQELAQRYPNVQVESFEVWYVPDNQALFQLMAAAHNFEPRYVPTIFIGGRQWEGFSDALRAEIEAYVKACVETGCPDAGAGIVPGHAVATETPAASEVCNAEATECDRRGGWAHPAGASIYCRTRAVVVALFMEMRGAFSAMRTRRTLSLTGFAGVAVPRGAGRPVSTA
jgi:thiol-disulfide isomerase/thioredoxin